MKEFKIMKNTIEQAIELLRGGDICVCPTETVYGLFGDAKNDVAIQRIYKTKGRPSCNPLICHVSSISVALDFCVISKEQERIIDYFWNEKNRPITFIVNLKENSDISNFVTAGLKTVAIRRPNNKIALELIEKFNGPLAAPSANTSTRLSPTSYDMVVLDLGDKVQCIIDGGECRFGVESTILDITRSPYVLLRPGGTSKEEIEEFLGSGLEINRNDTCIIAPGMMKKHYSPSIPVRINASFPLENEAFIAFGKTDVPYTKNLSLSGDLMEAAHNLFRFLKELDDKQKYSGISIMPIPMDGIGRAINDRISRASYKEDKKN